VTGDFNGDGSDETVRIGYNGWSDGEGNSSPRPLPGGFDTTWPVGYTTELQEDFSSPNSDFGARLAIWNLPEGEYKLTLYMRDWQYAASTYQVEVNDSTIFSVTHADMVAGDLSSISDSQKVNTVIFTPAHVSYGPAHSITIDRYNGKGAVMGIEVEYVPEPATMALLVLGGSAIVFGSARRRTRR
jgi:hypothetical protein